MPRDAAGGAADVPQALCKVESDRVCVAHPCGEPKHGGKALGGEGFGALQQFVADAHALRTPQHVQANEFDAWQKFRQRRASAIHDFGKTEQMALSFSEQEPGVVSGLSLAKAIDRVHRLRFARQIGPDAFGGIGFEENLGGENAQAQCVVRMACADGEALVQVGLHRCRLIVWVTHGAILNEGLQAWWPLQAARTRPPMARRAASVRATRCSSGIAAAGSCVVNPAAAGPARPAHRPRPARCPRAAQRSIRSAARRAACAPTAP
jgi:hypothetical protein